jgi:hypothetical protein
MKRLKSICLVLTLVLLGFGSAQAGISFQIGVGNFYNPVGDYDYLPYAYQTNPGFVAPRVNFYDMMGQYGSWVSVQPFGQAWQPYAAQGWRPYTQGRWINTQEYGPYWQGYEPWAWAAYHYGNWVFTQQFGWVWLPGYDWHAGQVAWGQGYDSIGWMPLPPQGYDYSRGYIGPAGPNNQFSYYDQDFGYESNGYVSYGGPYYDPRYRDSYYNQSFLGVAANLWTFISSQNFNSDNYANYYLPPDYTNYIFQQRIVRINPRPIDSTTLQRIVKQRIDTVPLRVQTLQTDRQPIKVIIPASDTSLQEIRRNANTVVRDVIAPAFAQKQKPFRSVNSAHRQEVSKIFNQDANAQPKVETIDSDQLVQKARQDREQREQRRVQNAQQAKQKIETVVKEGKVRPAKNRNEKQNEQGAGSQGRQTPPEPNRVNPGERPQGAQEQPDLNTRPDQKEKPANTPAEERRQDQRNKNKQKEKVRPNSQDDNSNGNSDQDNQSVREERSNRNPGEVNTPNSPDEQQNVQDNNRKNDREKVSSDEGQASEHGEVDNNATGKENSSANSDNASDKNKSQNNKAKAKDKKKHNNNNDNGNDQENPPER